MEQVAEFKKLSLQDAWEDYFKRGEVRNFLDRMKVILNVVSDSAVYMYIRGLRKMTRKPKANT